MEKNLQNTNNDNKNQVNRLSKEKSPYLKQHQYNPVDWYAWGDEAFLKAENENKPIFLSIGYSTCHWCHVMENESFSDPEIAKLMNEVFINIKVDREERPDVDNIYMTVCQILNGSGGWPLNVIMTPHRKPFFAGTYFPKESRKDNPGIKDIILRTKEIWEKYRNEIISQAEENTAQINSVVYKAGNSIVNQNSYRKAFYELASNYDELNGGFGRNIKFPIPHYFMFLIRYAYRTNSTEAMDMVTKTLKSMRYGGIWDHVGYGFHRYSTDPEWKVPHFEKMLYDQALLAIAYIEAYQYTADPIFKQTAQNIFEYLTNNMLSDEGGFYSAEDADSEGEEGKYYLWKFDEIKELLIGNVELFSDVFNLRENGNYFNEISRKYDGNNILYRTKSTTQIATKFAINESEVENKINNLLNVLFERRIQRAKPHLDNKILTDWNGLVIWAFSKAALVFDNNYYAETALKTINFIKSKMLNSDYTLLHRYAESDAAIMGMIDDYAYILIGLLEYYEYSKEKEYLELAENIANKFIELFSDIDGGFFYTSSKSEKLISRKKEIHDGAMPSGNSIMLDVLLKLYSYTDNSIYFSLAEKMIRAFSTAINSVPSAYSYFLCSLDRYFNDTINIGFAGTEDFSELISNIRQNFNPNLNIIDLSKTKKEEILSEYQKNILEKNHSVACYICVGTECYEPIIGMDNIKKELLEKYNIKF
jgi:uncharacterized protein YyaL (SSP411 family)